MAAEGGPGVEGKENSAAPVAEGSGGSVREPVYENGKQVLTFGMLSDFNGRRSLEEAVGVIQRQVGIYVAE